LSIFAEMQTFDTIAYFSGMTAGVFFLTSLICGLQLCFNIFWTRKNENRILSHLVGAIFLLMSVSTICYIVYDTFFSNMTLLTVGSTIDYIMFCLSAVAAYVLYSGNCPTIRTIIILSVPFVILATINICFPDTGDYLLDAVILILILQYSFFAILLRRYEASLGDLYSSPDSHSLSWIRGVIALFVGWWVARTVMRMPAINIWYDIVMYMYMVLLVSFVFIKINRLAEPVSQETRKQIEKVEWKDVRISNDISSPMKKELIRLLEEEHIYLDSDLTVIDVVKRLGTNTKYFSAMLHNDMQTTFCVLINEYRIEEAKKLLLSTDNKIESIAMSCGFNSLQSFCRTFSKITGKKPTDFRKDNTA